MPLRVVVQALRQDVRKQIDEIGGDMAKAATEAMRAVGESVKQRARLDIAQAGFSTKWQNALRLKHFPENGYSIDPAAFIYHKIPYAGVFEYGPTTITAKGRYMWIPIAKNLPARAGLHRITPAFYEKNFGKLQFVQRPGKPPLLFAKAARGGRRPRGAGGQSLFGKTPGFGPKPLFFGVRLVKVRDRFHIKEIADAGMAELGAQYFARIKPNG